MTGRNLRRCRVLSKRQHGSCKCTRVNLVCSVLAIRYPDIPPNPPRLEPVAILPYLSHKHFRIPSAAVVILLPSLLADILRFRISLRSVSLEHYVFHETTGPLLPLNTRRTGSGTRFLRHRFRQVFFSNLDGRVRRLLAHRTFGKLNQLFHHQFSRRMCEFLHILGREVGCGYRWEDFTQPLAHPPIQRIAIANGILTLHRYPPGPKPLLPHTQHPPIIRTHNRHNRHPRLHRQMKRPLLELRQKRSIRITPRALRENKHALPTPLHLLRRARKRLDRTLPIPAIDEHRPTQRHEPSQEGYASEGFLSRHAAVLREYRTQQQHIQFTLMIPHQDTRPRVQILRPGNNLKSYAGEVAHRVFEGARGGPLADAVVAEQAEGQGGEHAVGGAEEEREVGG